VEEGKTTTAEVEVEVNVASELPELLLNVPEVWSTDVTTDVVVRTATAEVAVSDVDAAAEVCAAEVDGATEVCAAEEDGATTSVLVGCVPEGAGATTTVLVACAVEEDGATTTVLAACAVEEDGATTTVLVGWAAEEDGTTTTVLVGWDEEGDGATTTVLVACAAEEDGATTTVLVACAAEEDGATTTVLVACAAEEDGATTTVLAACAVEEDGATTTVLVACAVEEDGATTTVLVASAALLDVATPTIVVVTSAEDEPGTTATTVVVAESEVATEVVEGLEFCRLTKSNSATGIIGAAKTGPFFSAASAIVQSAAKVLSWSGLSGAVCVSFFHMPSRSSLKSPGRIIMGSTSRPGCGICCACIDEVKKVTERKRTKFRKEGMKGGRKSISIFGRKQIMEGLSGWLESKAFGITVRITLGLEKEWRVGVRIAYRTDGMAGAAWEWSWQQGQLALTQAIDRLSTERRETKGVDLTTDW